MENKQTILITGATGNIGCGAAIALVKRGAKVVLIGHRPEMLECKKENCSILLLLTLELMKKILILKQY